jgi:DNA ligase (NAD+)
MEEPPKTIITREMVLDVIPKINDNPYMSDSFTVEQLRAVLIYCQNEYFNSEVEPEIILTDQVYDYLRSLYIIKSIADGTYVENVDGFDHVPVPSNRMKKLPIWMGAMNKTMHGSGQILIWKEKHPGPYHLSGKMDGGSALYFHEDGKDKLYSRGRKDEGQDISELIPFLNLPKLEKGYIIRGELILQKSVFAAKYKRADRKDKSDKTKYGSSRNAVGGLTNRVGARANGSKGCEKPLDVSFLPDLKFIAYEVITTPPMKASDQFAYLDAHYGPNVAPHGIVNDVNDEYLSKAFDHILATNDYELDGVIITSDHVYERVSGKNPHQTIAYKKPLAVLSGITTILEVEWTASKDGYLNPVGIYETVSLKDGSHLDRVSLYNAKNVVDNVIGPGSVVEITRSGGVIPMILKFIHPAKEPSLPKIPYAWIPSRVDIYSTDTDPNSETNRDIIVGKIYFFLDSIGTMGIGETIVAKIYETVGLRTIPQLWQLEQKHLLFLGPKASQNHIDTIKKCTRNIPLNVMMAACGIFGRGAGLRRFTALLEAYPQIMLSAAVINNDVEALTKGIAQIEGFKDVFPAQIAKNFYPFRIFLEELKAVGYTQDLVYRPKVATIVVQDHPLKGLNIVLTGVETKAITKFVTERGATIQSGVVKSTDLVVSRDGTYSSTKTKSANKKGIKIITMDEFSSTYGL